jgi:hypothetical protein
VLFGDVGNDWLVGGTNEDHLYGGYGNDLLNADDNLDSTRVDVTVTYASLKALTILYAGGDANSVRDLTNALDNAQYEQARGRIANQLDKLREYSDHVLDSVDKQFTPDQAATLTRLVTALGQNDPLANNIPDPRGTAPAYADIAVGGAGRDVLIANTSSDRLYDWYGEFNTYVAPWSEHEGEGHEGTWNDGVDAELVQYLTDLAISDGADTTRGGDILRNGEPYGELGLVQYGDADWRAQIGEERDEELTLRNAPDEDSLGFTVLRTPSATVDRLERLHLDSTSEALLHRVILVGQLTASDQSLLSVYGTYALNKLVSYGYVVKTNGLVVATDKLWIAVGLADAPGLESRSPSSGTPTTPITLTGTGDVGDTITIYTGTTAVATGMVSADGRWTITLTLPVGVQQLTAKQTVNALPHVGLTSAASESICITIYPNAPSITSVSTPAVTTTTAPVTVAGRGDAGDTIALYDGWYKIATAIVAAGGTWSLIVSLAVGTHSLTAVQATPVQPILASGSSNAVSVRVYAPPAAPTISSTSGSSPLTVSGTGVAGDTLTLYEGAAVLGTVAVGSGGGWSLSLSLAIGTHVLTAKQADPVSGGVSAMSSNVTVTVNPSAPPIVSVSTPAVTTTSSPVTVTGTGDAGDTVALYDGATKIATVVVGAGGGWTLTVSLAVGTHSLTATQTTSGIVKFTSAPSAPVTVRVYAPPPAPTISAPANSATALTVNGTGGVGNTISVYDGTTLIGTALVGSGGTWSLALTLTLGAHSLSTKQRDPAAGGTSVASSSVTVNVYTTPPPPAITSVTRATSTATVSGTGIAGQTITLYDGTTAIATVVVGAGGTWSKSVSLGIGSHSLTATQYLVSGVPSAASAPVVVTVPSR